jgi:hypothetical protein
MEVLMSEPINNKNKVVLDGYRFTGRSVGAVSTRYSGRNQFLTMVTFEQVVRLFPKVDPAKPHDRNRKVDAKRAKAAGQYWLDHPNDWIFPPLILTLDDELSYESIEGFDVRTSDLDLQMVKLILPPDFEQQAFIADGQHRTYGMNQIYVERHAKLKEAREELRSARDSGASDNDLQRLQSVIDAVTHDISRFERETIGVQIIANANKSLQQEWFITMSDYQKPIGRGESVRMDEKTNLTNAAKQIVSSHSLFAGEFPRIDEETANPRVDERKDNVARGSGAIYSLANIRDWVATLVLGSKSETSVEKLDEITSVDQIVDLANAFFDALVESVPYFEQLDSATLQGAEFRKLNGFSSPTIIRGLALAANAELIGSPSLESGEPIDLEVNDAGLSRFKKLLSNLVSELEYIDDPARTKPQKKRMKQGDWYATQLFREGATAPQSGFQDRARLGNMLTEWSQKGKIDFAPFVKTSGSV